MTRPPISTEQHVLELLNAGQHLSLRADATDPSHRALSNTSLAHHFILARLFVRQLNLPNVLQQLPLIATYQACEPVAPRLLSEIDRKLDTLASHFNLSLVDLAEPLHTLLCFNLAQTSARAQRRSQGAYYTPPNLAAWLTRQVLPSERPTTSTAPLRIYDLCCGCGAFLVAAAEHLIAANLDPTGIGGRDIDPVAVDVSRLRLFSRIAEQLSSPSEQETLAKTLIAQISTGDGLMFQDQALDAVISNPPFGSAVTSDTTRSKTLSSHHKAVVGDVATGAYDQSFVFAAHMVAQLRDGGRYGFILPMSALSLSSGAGLRARLERQAPPLTLWVPSSASLFPGADIFVALMAGKRAQMSASSWTLQVSTSPPTATCEPTTPLRQVIAQQNTTWSSWLQKERALELALTESEATLVDLGQLVTIHGGATTGAAYMLKPLIHDTPSGDGLKLITTGLIDRYTCLWGERRCRYLKMHFQTPRWPNDTDSPPQVMRAYQRQQTAKVLVGGLSRVIEAIADTEGELGGVVSTWVVRPAPDFESEAAIWLLEALLNSSALSLLYMTRYRGKELSGGNTTIGQRELKALPVPDDLMTLAQRASCSATCADWRDLFDEDDRGKIASLAVTAVQRPHPTRGAGPSRTQDALADAAISALYGIDLETHEAISRWHSQRMKRSG